MRLLAIALCSQLDGFVHRVATTEGVDTGDLQQVSDGRVPAHMKHEPTAKVEHHEIGAVEDMDDGGVDELHLGQIDDNTTIVLGLSTSVVRNS